MEEVVERDKGKKNVRVDDGRRWGTSGLVDQVVLDLPHRAGPPRSFMLPYERSFHAGHSRRHNDGPLWHLEAFIAAK